MPGQHQVTVYVPAIIQRAIPPQHLGVVNDLLHGPFHGRAERPPLSERQAIEQPAAQLVVGAEVTPVSLSIHVSSLGQPQPTPLRHRNATATMTVWWKL